MKKNNYLDPSLKNKGEELVSQQILDSYHSGVIDSDREANSKGKNLSN
ncbi:hypothetical protein [Aquibacillus saliphilus]|nr:hypothetical protein [Aquibacillus saliphilus]